MPVSKIRLQSAHPPTGHSIRLALADGLTGTSHAGGADESINPNIEPRPTASREFHGYTVNLQVLVANYVMGGWILPYPSNAI